jgi:hypothetical protein
MHTRFWKDVWIGDSPLCIRFPWLYSISLQKIEYVDVLLNVDGERRWNFFGEEIFFNGR